MRYLPLLFLLTACADQKSEIVASASAPQVFVCTDPAVDTARVLNVNVVESVTSFDTGLNGASEMVSCLPTTWKTGYTKLPLYAVRLHDLKKDDVLIAVAEMEFTNDTGVNVMIGSYMTLGEFKFDALEVNEANGWNITPGNHHGTLYKEAIMRIPRDMPDVYLVVWVYAATDGLPAASLKVEQDYGRLQGLILR